MMTTVIITPSHTTAADIQQGALKATPADLVNALHAAFGDHHVRAVHAKGVILEGSFTPDDHAYQLTQANHLQKQASKVLVRFSDFTGIPDIPDNAGAANPRGFAIKFIMPDSSTTDIVGHSFNGFPTANSDQFRELLLAIAASGPDAAKPTPLDQFLTTHPVAKIFLTTQHLPQSYAGISYFGVNSFKFTNAEGVAHFVRYRFVPEEGEKLLTPEQYEKESDDYLVDEIKIHVAANPVRFTMYAQVAEKDDRIEDPSIAWPDSRTLVRLGLIEITGIADNSVVADKQLFFIPNNVPNGIEPADPMLTFRSHTYPISWQGRQ